jgi:hypothetical protein
LVLIVILIIGGVVIFRSGQTELIGGDLSGPQVNITSIPGDAAYFDPIVAYDAVHKFAGATYDLSSIRINYVRSDGTLDLNAPYDPTIQYEFVRELQTPPPSMPPVGVQGVTDQKWDDQIEVLIQPTRMLSTQGYVQGRTIATAPKCSLKTLWSAAMEKGASKDAVATILFSATGYHFSIRSTSITLEFDNDCHLKPS